MSAPTLTVHHLGVSQSERIVWLCEELEVPYNLKCHKRSPVFAPAELKGLAGNITGSAPFMQDGAVTLCESAAIVEYILTRHNPRGLLRGPPPDSPDYAHHLYWLHAANGSLQPAVAQGLVLATAGVPEDARQRRGAVARREALLRVMDERLGAVDFLGGRQLSAADVMCVTTVTTMRYFVPFSLAAYPNVLAWLQRIGERPAYRRAMDKGDPGMELLLGAEPPKKGVL